MQYLSNMISDFKDTIYVVFYFHYTVPCENLGF